MSYRLEFRVHLEVSDVLDTSSKIHGSRRKAGKSGLIKEATDTGVLKIARYCHDKTVQADGKKNDTSENMRKRGR